MKIAPIRTIKISGDKIDSEEIGLDVILSDGKIHCEADDDPDAIIPAGKIAYRDVADVILCEDHLTFMILNME